MIQSLNPSIINRKEPPMSHPATPIPPAKTSDGVDRRGFLKCMAWAGTGVLWTMKGGILTGCTLQNDPTAAAAAADFSFVQLSDSHIGFAKEPNQNVVSTLQEAIRRVNA